MEVSETLGKILSSSVKPKMWLMALIYLAGSVAAAFAGIISMIAVIFLGALTGSAVGVLAGFLAGMAAMLLVVFVVASILLAAMMEAARNVLPGKDFRVEDALAFGIRKWKTLFGTIIVYSVIWLVVLIAAFAPAFFGFLGVMQELMQNPAQFAVLAGISQTSAPAEAVSALFPLFAPIIPLVLLGAAVSAVAFLVLTPLMVLFYPSAVFSGKGVRGSVSHAFALGKKHYLRNFVFSVFLGLLYVPVVAISFFDFTGIIAIAVGLWMEIIFVLIVTRLYLDYTTDGKKSAKSI